MKVVVVGAGEVGTHLTSFLSQEGHDVIIIDKDEERVARAQNQLDALVVRGNGASVGVLEQAGAATAEMIIAVTDLDEVNIVACVSGKTLGIPRRIARVKDLDYFAQRSGRSMQQVGVDMMINPDVAAALEIERLVSLPGATDVTDFGDARVRMIGMHMGSRSPIAGMPLSEVDRKHGPLPLTVVAILREERTIIPDGNTVLETGDHVFLIGESWLMPDVMQLVGQDVAPARNVMLVGAGPVSRHLARYLASQKVGVKIIELQRTKAERASRELDKAMVLHGDGTDVDLLQSEGVENMDAFIAVTNDEETNVMSCLLARRLGAKKTLALIRRTNYVPLVHAVGIDAAVSVRLSTAAAIKHYFRKGQVLSFAQLKENDAEALELLARAKTHVVKCPLRKLQMPKGSIIGAIVRGAEVIIPRGDTQIEEGDRVVVFALPSAVEAVQKMFA
jgi:trk/ktr system potassium uptake protein